MLLVDDLLMLPFSGFGFILRTLQRVAEQEYTDDQPVKERLLELQLRLESGAITEHQYVLEETYLLSELREVRERRRTLEGAPPEERGLVFTPGETQASVSVNFHQDRGRKARG